MRDFTLDRHRTWAQPMGKCGTCRHRTWAHLFNNQVKVERIWDGVAGTKCYRRRGSLEDPFVKRTVKKKGDEEEKNKQTDRQMLDEQKY